MIWLRLLMFFLGFLLFGYYLTIALHLLGVIKITSLTVTAKRALCPFYLWTNAGEPKPEEVKSKEVKAVKKKKLSNKRETKTN